LAAEAADVGFRFAPASGQTMSWLATESESASFGGKHAESVRWSEKLTLTFGRELPDGFEAKLTVSSVTPEVGTPDTLHYTLARAVADRPIDVIVDATGYVREVRNWGGVQADMVAALAGLGDAASAKLFGTLLGSLDAARAGAAVARPLLLQSAAYGLAFKSDGSTAEYPDWRGGSAYIFPGRKIATRLIGKKDALLFAEWSLTTDPKAAAEHVGGEVLSLLNAASQGDASLAEASRTASVLLATGGLDLGEEAGLVFDASVRRITRFQHRVRLNVGDFHKQQEVVVDLVP
jgi:hypothetical protein